MRNRHRKSAPEWVRTNATRKQRSTVWELLAAGCTIADVEKRLELRRMHLDKDTISKVIQEAVGEPGIPAALVKTLKPVVQEWIISKRPYLRESVLGAPPGSPEGQVSGKLEVGFHPGSPHEQNMRELARELMNEIRLPGISSSFILELKPGQIVIADSWGRALCPLIVIGENGKISFGVGLEHRAQESDLWQGLYSHLETGGFSGLWGEISDWEGRVGQCLQKCHDFLRLAIGEIGKLIKIPDDKVERHEKMGYKEAFFTTACGDAIQIAMGDSPADFGYCSEALPTGGLWALRRYWGGIIYVAKTEMETEELQEGHDGLRCELSQTPEARDIARLRAELELTEAKIKKQLQKSTLMKRVPGYCELCAPIATRKE